MKKIPLKEFKQVISLQKKISNHFTKVTGIIVSEIKFIYLIEEYQSDCDGDANNIVVEITSQTDLEGDLRVIDILSVHELLNQKFDMYPTVTQVITGSAGYPTVTTKFVFSYYNFTKK